jgi:hypothetical protein
LLAELNKACTENAALLIVIISGKTLNAIKYSIIHHFDARSAWENLALETSSRGLVSHGMQGFDYEKARVDLEIPDNFDVMIMIAIGKKGPKKNLPLQLQEKERPDDRILLKEIIMKDNFKNKNFFYAICIFY